MKFVGTKLPCILGREFAEATWLYCVHFISCILYCVCYNLSCSMWVSVCVVFVMCGFVCVWDL